MLALRDAHPKLLGIFFEIARPFLSVKLPIRFRPLLLKFLQPCDADVLRETRAFESCFESARKAWIGSATGVMADAEIYATPWGFRLEEVRVPVRLWHGTKDRTFSYRLAEQIAARLPNCQHRVIEDAGHYSLPIRNMREILADLISVGETPSSRLISLLRRASPYRRKGTALDTNIATSRKLSLCDDFGVSETALWKISPPARRTISRRDANQK